MLKNYILIAWRNLIKHSSYTAIHILGLGIGFVAAFLIVLFIRDELSYDRFHTNIDDLYRLNFYGKMGDQEAHTSQAPGPAGPLFQSLFPEVEAACRIKTAGDFSVRVGDKAYRESRLAYADSSLFRLFTFAVREGSTSGALNRPGQVIINATTAKKYFGAENALGKTLVLDKIKTYTVSAVIEDLPGNSHFQFDFFLPMAENQDSYVENWGSTNYHTYFLLKPGTRVEALSSKMNESFREKFNLVLKQYLNSSLEEFTAQGNYARVELFPVRKIHLYSNLDDELAHNGNISLIYIFGLAGFLILLLAGINFVNLSTARASVRSREVGVRKSIGALNRDLTLQFLAESMLVCLLCWLMAMILVSVSLPWFNNLAGKSLEIGGLFNAEVLIPLVIIALVTGFTAGIYPALFLSALEPVKVLKGTLGLGLRKSKLRSGLVIFQFFVSIVLIIGSLSIYRQVEYIQNKKLGYTKEQVLVISDAYLLGNQLEAFKNRLKAMPPVKNLSVGAFLPVSSERNTTSIVLGNVPSPGNTFLVNNWWTDPDFLKTLEIELVQGRDFFRAFPADSQAVIINETLARFFGYPGENLEGQVIGLPRDSGKIVPYHLIGVVRDFNFLSLHHPIEPLAIFYGGTPDFITIRAETGQIQELLREIESGWNQLARGSPFTYDFLDDRYRQLYGAETKMGKIAFVFAFLAIFIASMGLLGLVAFTIQQRFKEIGIRKVLGASLPDLLSLVSKDFILLIGAAILFACPLSWWLVQQWLKRFVFRMDPGPGLFIGTALGTVLIALVIVGLQTMKAALANPVKSLRTE